MCLPSATLSTTNYIIWLPSATLRIKLYRVRLLQHASNSLQSVSCIFARNKYNRLSSFGNVQPPAILILHQEPLKF